MISRLRLYRSAACPAGIASKMTGSTCARPTIPSARGELVRSYSSQPMATPCIWLPTVATIPASTRRRKLRSRSTV